MPCSRGRFEAQLPAPFSYWVAWRFPASRLFPTPILATTELINAWLRDSAHLKSDAEAVFSHSRPSKRRRRPMARDPSKRPRVDRDEPITPIQSA
jgi:hypothetical protein